MKKCEVCGGTHFVKVKAKERMFGLGDPFEYQECISCGGLFLQNIPEDLGKFYPEDYYSFGSHVTSGAIGKFLKKARFNAFKAGVSLSPPVYFEWLSNLDITEKSKIADIGCGNGQLLAELSYCGFESLVGYDPFLNESKDYHGFQLRKTDFFDITEKFDLVMFHHSFEHIPDPVRLFQKLEDILNPGGQALIRVPVTDGQVWKDSREYWFQLDAPRHLFIPSVKSMEILAKSVSLSLDKVVFDSMASQFWATELYKKGIPLVGTDESKEFSTAELQSFKEKAADFNQRKIGDQACFYFNKRK